MRGTGLFINWEYNNFGTLTADFYGIGIFEKVDFEYVQGDIFEICIKQPKRSDLERQLRTGRRGSDDGRPTHIERLWWNMMTALEKRYQVAIDKIGHARLLNLPEQIKELLKNTKDLKTKTELLEEIAKNIQSKPPAWRSAGTAPPAPMRQGA